ncbi:MULTISPECIES: sugar nucleotide-binding protein [unclassified Photobacterium]|uniref:sugar nucleotide-binding protein n=1 Tax=unclassified Photobacterium TaxID=2628852 RepID=UPI000D167919|nr:MULTISPECIES: sugar nucleotide-binding protein [unclassified Photobacterium]PSV33120.1 NAD(P)-dependent oxidoreductase [Photobacterium sp. GB-72]PSV40919.1 NAD(P)-dependent oxidoreductase [Photobacterium sp. GB-210]PSV47978.1 NAD(P)-dependent oxidoreductase [Photobacterium sp. GB-36]PSV55077.1 NAD(P)-dependent oxidoreductase [Photobacterium sp. GB-1]PSW75183.1 NAD(P)-dependent oxidoreductase [Photobacterium sp. GB-50]
MNIAICGCGWLGLPLAKALYKKGHNVYGTKRNEREANALSAYGIHGVPMQLPLTEDVQVSSLATMLASDVMVINIAAGRNSIDKEQHYQNVLSLSNAAYQSGCQRIIFISTTSVYDGRKGRVAEDDDVMPLTDSALTHVKIENSLRTQWGDQLTIVRLSGLIGEDRHPVKFLAGRNALKGGSNPVNLIHLEDCVAAIVRLVGIKDSMPVLHLASDFHPTRSKYYTQMAKQLSLPLPEFLPDDESSTAKVIDAAKTLTNLGYVLKHRDLMLSK